MSKFFSAICALILIAGIAVGGFYIGKSADKSDSGNDNAATIFDLGQVVDLTGQDGEITSAQATLLSRGAVVKYDNDVYQLYQVGDSRVYTCVDSMDEYTRKYIQINNDGTFTRWSKTNTDYVDKALLSSVLSEYLKTGEFDETIKDYATNGELDEALSSALANYMKSSEVKSQLAQMLAGYVLYTHLTGLVTNKLVYNQLTFKTNTLYAVQCYDKTQNLADFTIIGGSKDGKKGRFALVFVGNKVSESLILYQTGSALISDLAATSGGSTGIKPAASSNILSVYEIGGKVL